MAFPLVPVAIGTAVAIALGYGLMKASGAKVPSPDAAKKARDAVLSKGYDAGRLEGAADGKADAGKAHDPRPLLNYSTDAEVQKSYENGYNDGYESSWVAPPTVDVVHDSTPSAGGASKGMSAYDYGYSRGRSTGYKDGIDGKDADMKSPLETSGSLKRQAESGNPAEYRRGYADGYRVGYVKGIEKASEGSVSIITSGVGRDSYVSVGAWGTRNAVLAVRRKIGGSSTPADKARAESMPSSTKSRALAHAKKTNPFKLHDFTVPEPGGPPSGAPLRVTPATPDPRATQNPNAPKFLRTTKPKFASGGEPRGEPLDGFGVPPTQVAGGDWRHW